MDYFSALNIFHSVAETGSFSKTAQTLDLAVSSVTRQIDNLEQSLGVTLFARSTRQISLTHSGQLYLDKTLPIVDDLTQANLSLKSELNEPQGRLKISFFPALVPMISPVLTEFAAQYPKIRLEIWVSDDYVDFAADRVDLAVRMGQVNNPNLIAKVLRTQKRLVCASPAYLANMGEPTEPNALFNHNCLTYRANKQVQYWYFSQAGKRGKSVRVKGSLTANSADLLKAYALADLGVVHLPDWVLAEELASGRLVSLFDDWQVKSFDHSDDDAVYLVYPPNSRQVAKIELFVAMLQEIWA
ncbi:MAG: LysR family transcriptional regulator [Neisseria sp.]|nr:LysR family transcriptional regulator [Neisseria sp.]